MPEIDQSVSLLWEGKRRKRGGRNFETSNEANHQLHHVLRCACRQQCSAHKAKAAKEGEEQHLIMSPEDEQIKNAAAKYHQQKCYKCTNNKPISSGTQKLSTYEASLSPGTTK